MIPGCEPAPAPATLSIEMKYRIDVSVAQFERKFASFGMLSIARTSGWIEEYRKELTAVALAAKAER